VAWTSRLFHRFDALWIPGALTLTDVRAELIRLDCRRCDCRGQYRRATLVGPYGKKAALPDVLAQLALDCPSRSEIGNEPCGAYFPDLSERSPTR
jgi:hypothetical protein